tara:strand:+ start:342 stop:623 length:282 start_codon:yes stop_codon:yes gene_type:complete
MRTLVIVGLLLGATACGEGSPVDAKPWDSAGACWGPSEQVGTTSAEACDDALTLGTGPDDGCFLFSDSCLPEDGVWAPGCVDTDVSVDAADCP